jgi:hypothetical protein
VQERHRPLDQIGVDAPRGQLVRPPRRLVLEPPKRAFARDPELFQDARRDLRRLVVGQLPELPSRPQALDEQRAEPVVPLEQPYGADTVPARERVRLVLALLVRIADLEDGVSGRNDQRNVGLEGPLEPERPALDELRDDPGQPLEPLAASGLAPPPGEP